MSKALDRINRLSQLRLKKSMFENTFTLIARYVQMRTVSFTDTGQFTSAQLIPDELFDNTVTHVGDQAKSSALGSVWPNSGSSFELERHRSIQDSEDIKKWFKEVNGVMHDVMNDPKSGLQVALEEAISDMFDYGTASVVTMEKADIQNPVKYKSWSIIGMFIDENADGFVDTIYYTRSYTARQLVQKYGVENVSVATARMYDEVNTQDTPINVLITIEPRRVRDPASGSLLDAPFESLHIEIGSKKILKETGFAEMPAAVGRMRKYTNEVWGRSPGINALPDVIEINAVWEAITIAVEKILDPPLALLDDGRLGAGDIDTSAGALNVFSVGGRITGSNMIFPLFTIGEIEPVAGLVDKLANSISQFYLVDRLLDLNNQNEMTLGEAEIRNNMRGTSLASMFVRLMAELFVPIIDRTFNILLRNGYFGVIPDSQMEEDLFFQGRKIIYLPPEVIQNIFVGEKVYSINFISPAARMIQNEEANGIMTLFRVAAESANIEPGVLDNFNVDKMVRKLASILGVSMEVLESTEAVQQVRVAKQQAAQQQAEIVNAREVSEIQRNNAQATATMSGQGLQ